jgi:hypothetical protein
MDIKNTVVQLCQEGIQAEFEGRKDDACSLYWKAWMSVRDDYDACIAAHYVARCQDDPHQALYWNLEALRRAESVGDERVASFLPSLYVNLGYSYELLGDEAESKHFYQLAAGLGLFHSRPE